MLEGCDVVGYFLRATGKNFRLYEQAAPQFIERDLSYSGKARDSDRHASGCNLTPALSTIIEGGARLQSTHCDPLCPPGEPRDRTR